jgi:hypothetical protein
MSVRTLGEGLAAGFSRGLAVGAETTWDSHVRVWLGESKRREQVEDFDVDGHDEVAAWLMGKLKDRDSQNSESESGAVWTQLWRLMRQLFEKEIDTGFQTDPRRQQITAWIGNEYYGHLAERTFTVHEFERYEVNRWLADESGRTFTGPVDLHRPARDQSTHR